MPKSNFSSFAAWNFAEAQLAIESLLSNESTLSEDASKFLTKLLERLKAFSWQVEAIYDYKSKTLGADPIELVDQYKNQTREAIDAVQAECESLLSLIEKEAQRYVQAYPTSNESYLNFLSDLENCCHGVSLAIDDFKNKVDIHIEKLVDAATIAKKMGTHYVPMCQFIDPMKGAKFTNKDETFGPTSGHCAGDVFDWVEQRKIKGTFRIQRTLNQSSYKKFKYQNKAKNAIKNSKEFGILNILSVMSDFFTFTNNNLYYVALDNTEKEKGHAVGIRKIPNTERVEFFDPNLGTFIFPNETVFSHFFNRLIFSYQLQGKNYNLVTFFDCGTQCMDEVYLPKFSNSKESSIESIDDVILKINNLYKQEEKNNFNKISRKKIITNFIKVLPSYIYSIKSIDEICIIKEKLENLDFLFGKSTFFSAFFYKDTWHSTDAAKQVATILNQKKEELLRIEVKQKEFHENNYITKFFPQAS